MQKSKEQIKWIKRPHPIFGEGGAEFEIHALIKTTFPKWQWVGGFDQRYSIIEPSDISMNLWELFDREEIYRFKTLEEAQEKANNLFIK